MRAGILRSRRRFLFAVNRKGSGLEFGDHFAMLLRQALVQLLRQGFRFRSAGKLLIAGAALINYPAGHVDDGIEKGMRRTAVLRLNVIHCLPDTNIRVEAEVHGPASLSRRSAAMHSFPDSNWFKENTELSFGC